MNPANTRRNLRHLCRFGALALIIWLVNCSHQDFLLQMQARNHAFEPTKILPAYPGAVSMEEDKDAPGVYQVLDQDGKEITRLTQTSPAGDTAIGFSGPTNLLVALDKDDKVTSVSIRSSLDTADHVDAITEEPAFFQQFEGKTPGELAKGMEVDAVSGATLTCLAITDALALRFGGSATTSRFPQPIELEEAKKYFPDCAGLEPSENYPSLLDVLDANGNLLGRIGRTSPHADQVIGYQGPVDTLLAVDKEGKLSGMEARSSFENQPYADYPNDDAYFSSLFKGRTIPELSKMDLIEEEVEGVSGATMTSMAMAEGIVKTTAAWEQELAEAQQKEARPLVNWRLRDTGSLAVLLLAGFVAFTKKGKNKKIRLIHQILLVGYLGLINGDILSQALFSGWAQSGVPWQRAPALALLSLAAILVPLATGKPFYCHQLCPHGAAQQWMGKIRKKPVHLPARWSKALEFIPMALLGFVLVVAFHKYEFPLAMLEPFDAYVWKVAGAATITIALAGLAASAFIPMAYCRFGCPTGALLKLFESRAHDQRWGSRDYLAFGLLGLAIILSY